MEMRGFMSFPILRSVPSLLDPSVIPKANHISLSLTDQPLGGDAQTQAQGGVQKVTYTNIRVNSVEEIQ